MLNKLQTGFKDKFNKEADNVFFSPGRVNIIGEHIDYNGGVVFPCALSIGTYGAVSYRDDETVRVYSENFSDEGIYEFKLSEINNKSNDFTDFIKAVITEFAKEGFDTKSGFDLYIYGNIPNGSGLSSSASLELLIAEIIKYKNNFNVLRINMVRICKNAENNYIGVNCGIMDQFAIGMGKKDNGILLNTQTLEYKYIPFKIDGYSFVIMNTNKKRQLTDSKYNERRAECEKALEIINKKIAVKSLCQLKSRQLPEVERLLNDKTLYKRVLHCVSENTRVQTLVKELEAGNLATVGQLLTRSHQSLAENYEVTGAELDWIVASVLTCKGVLGARMTGAGFGGCAIVLVKNENIDEMIEKSSKFYTMQTGLTAEYIVADVADGTKLLWERG